MKTKLYYTETEITRKGHSTGIMSVKCYRMFGNEPTLLCTIECDHLDVATQEIQSYFDQNGLFDGVELEFRCLNEY